MAPDQTDVDIADYLKLMPEKNASDLFFSTGAPVNIKIEGVTAAVNDRKLAPGEVKNIAYSLMSDAQTSEFERGMEMDLAVSMHGLGRFRVNVFRQRGEVSMVVRYIKGRVAGIADLNLPLILQDLVMEPRGMVLVVGTTGSGKSTTLASMIAHRNRHQTGHILTIEDPIEYIHEHDKSVINQREVGLDTLSYAHALKRAMREAPDVIMIGEIRDRETLEQAISYAETGHLCLSTMHVNNANQTLERIVNFFPDTAHHELYMDLSLNLRAIVAQRLVIGTDGLRVPAVEILLTSAYVQQLIQKGEIDTIKEAMEQGTDRGMQTFDQALYSLYADGKISMDEALRNADSRNNISLRIRLAQTGRADDSGGLALGGDDLGDDIGALR